MGAPLVDGASSRRVALRLRACAGVRGSLGACVRMGGRVALRLRACAGVTATESLPLSVPVGGPPSSLSHYDNRAPRTLFGAYSLAL